MRLTSFPYSQLIMGTLSTNIASLLGNGVCICFSSTWLFVISLSSLLLFNFTSAQSSLCRTTCGDIPINFPFGIDDGCGSAYYRNLLACSNTGKLEFRTPSGRYPVRNISYADPHILVVDPFMWNCQDRDEFRPTRPFSLDSSTHFSLSTQNEYLFFDCREDDVIIKPKPSFCERFPERCDSSCDSASYLCRHLPDCPMALSSSSCCSYYPKAMESLRLMLQYCSSYTSVYWRTVGVTPPYDQVPEYGIRVNFDNPVTIRCLQCQDISKGGGTCGFDTQTLSFLCLCKEGNSTTYCNDPGNSRHNKRVAMVSGTVAVLSFSGAVGIGAGIWYLNKLRDKAPVTCGVQSSENRLF